MTTTEETTEELPDYIQGRNDLLDGYHYVHGDCGQVVGMRRDGSVLPRVPETRLLVQQGEEVEVTFDRLAAMIRRARMLGWDLSGVMSEPLPEVSSWPTRRGEPTDD